MKTYKVKKPSTGFRQKGGSVWGMLFNCGAILFVVYLCLKIMPEYASHSAVEGALEISLDKFPDASSVKKGELISNMQRQFSVDGISVPNLEEVMVITKDKSSVKVDIGYEKKVHLFSNLGVYLTFETSAEK